MFLHPVSSIHYYSCSGQQLCVFLCGNRAKATVESCRSFEDSTFELTECEDASSQRRNPLTGCPHSWRQTFPGVPSELRFLHLDILSRQVCGNFVMPTVLCQFCRTKFREELLLATSSKGVNRYACFCRIFIAFSLNFWTRLSESWFRQFVILRPLQKRWEHLVSNITWIREQRGCFFEWLLQTRIEP